MPEILLSSSRMKVMFVIHLVRDELGHTSVTLQDAFLICNINISCYTAKFTALFTSVKLRC